MNIDIAIVFSFLIITLVVGLVHGRNIKTIRDYALGGRNFSTGALVATIVATYASGSGFFITLSEVYSTGFGDLFASIGTGISLLIISLILAPRMGEFLGKISIAEAMGDLYGNKVRLITAIAATIGSAGFIAVQFKAFGHVVSYFVGISPVYAIVISGMITTIYSAFGGIRAVTFTDILQGIAFGVIIPLLGFVIWSHFFHSGNSLEAAFSNPKFDLKLLFDSSNSNFWSSLILFIYFAIPSISAPDFQRMSMASSIKQTKKSFFIAAILLIVIQITMSWIPFIVYSINPNLETNKLLSYIVDTFSFTGLRGLIAIAIIAFAMSTADSRINSSAVLFAHDIYGLLFKNKKNEILVSRIFACAFGFGTIALSLSETDLLSILVFANSFYSPVVIPPFLLTIFGFRSSSKSVLIGMTAGLIATLIWKTLPIEFAHVSQSIIGLYVAMFCNTISLLASHYILRQPGGWVGIKDRVYLDEQKYLHHKMWNDFADSVYRFNFITYCKRYVSDQNSVYIYFAILCMIMTYTTMFMTPSVILHYDGLLMFSYVSVLLISLSFIITLSFAPELKKKNSLRLYGC